MGYCRIKLIILTFVLFFVTAVRADEITLQEFTRLRADFYFLDGLVQKIEHSQIRVSASFSSYQNSYRTFVNQLQPQSSSRVELTEKLNQSSIVIFGDEHSNPVSQKNLVWIMEQMALNSKGDVTLVIEWIEKRYKQHLNDFMIDLISEEVLKEKIQFDKTWGFSWASHIEILRAAKRLKFNVIAAENKISENSGLPVPLRIRDNNVVRSVKEIFTVNSNARVLVAYGEAHLAGGSGDSHLREKLSAVGLSPDLVIFPWIGEAYWDVLQNTLDMKKSEVLRYSESEFFLDQGTVLREWQTLNYYFSQLGLGPQHLNFVKSKLTSEQFLQSQQISCKQLFVN